jgi:hypothetical protein
MAQIFYAPLETIRTLIQHISWKYANKLFDQSSASTTGMPRFAMCPRHTAKPK